VRRAVLTVLAVLAALTLALPAGAVESDAVQIRRVDVSKFPHVRVTVVVAEGTRPTLVENGRSPEFGTVRDLGSGQAMVLAVDNSKSMTGGPLREAKRAAGLFLDGQRRAATTGLVAFGHEALVMTRLGEPRSDVAQEVASLAADAQTGTSLYDAVELSVAQLKRMSNGSRILVLLTDGRDLGSRSTLSQAIAAAQRANVVVYSIAAGAKADEKPLAALASATGGRLFDADDATSLAATYRSLGQELERTWQLSYLSDARPGDRINVTVRAGGADATAELRIAEQESNGLVDLIPASVAHSPITAVVVVALVALLLGGAGAAGHGRRRALAVSRLLEPHVQNRDRDVMEPERRARFGSLFAWTERSLNELPGSQRLAQTVERSGLKLRVGHVPYLAGAASLSFGIVGTMFGAGPAPTLLLMLAGLVSPLLFFRIAAGRRTKAFDRQLPDVLATVASTLRAGHGLRPALRGIADDGSPPASHEFTRVLGEERLGRPLDEAIAAMCERIGSPDLEYVATAINVQSQAGGSLATLFDTLSETVRDRQKHARKVRALTSMGRMSAAILVCLPIGLAGLMTLINPSYMAPMYTTSTGHVLIGVCLTAMALGGLILRKIVNVRY
jgi:tight adherence protein B